MLNIEKYKDEIKENGGIVEIYKKYSPKGQKICGYENFYDDCIDWFCEEYKEPILTDKEREYLKAVFKPYATRISRVKKMKCCDRTEYLEIMVKSLVCDSYEYYGFITFLSNTAYKNMELDEPYTLEELGIEYGDEE